MDMIFLCSSSFEKAEDTINVKLPHKGGSDRQFGCRVVIVDSHFS
jgi:hypothetical protein